MCDVGGRVVARLLDGPVQAGERRLIRLPAQNWPQGVYFIDARSTGSRVVRRALIVR